MTASFQIVTKSSFICNPTIQHYCCLLYNLDMFQIQLSHDTYCICEMYISVGICMCVYNPKNAKYVGSVPLSAAAHAVTMAIS
jgi:hypothetical protein